jgi:hypothetical protein
MDRVRFIEHNGQQVLLIDHTNSTSAEMLQTLAEVEKLIGSQPSASVLVLCDFAGAKVNKTAADRMKVAAARDRPFVRKAAFVEAENIPDVYYRALRSFSAREFPNFKTREEALDWLVLAEEQSAAS